VPTRSRQPVVRKIPDKEPRAWNELLHDVANDFAALKLLLAAMGLADDDDERSRYLGTAKQTLVDGERRLQALREAVRRELEESKSIEASVKAKTKTRPVTKSTTAPIKKRST